MVLLSPGSGLGQGSEQLGSLPKAGTFLKDNIYDIVMERRYHASI